MDTIGHWHAYMERGDAAALDALLADEVVFESPAVHTPQRGRALTAKYLLAAYRVLGGPDFRYLHEWRADASAVLEFACVVDGMQVNGVDIVHWDAAGRITGFKVMVRPIKGLQAVMQRMGAVLAE
jgi:hypothetical protein